MPAGTARLGFAGAFLDTSYGLWKPLDSRVVVELGLPLGSNPKPDPGLDYAVVTERGVKERFAMDLEQWRQFANAEIMFELKRNASLDAHSAPRFESWYLVRLRH